MNTYDSVFDFIEDSMPELKKVQQSNMSKELCSRLSEVEDTLCDLLTEWWTKFNTSEG
jgi:hypothetical protein